MLWTCRAFFGVFVMTENLFPGRIHTTMSHHQWWWSSWSQESMLAQSSRSCAISRQRCFCYSTSNLGTNFADTCIMARSSVKIVWPDPMLIPTSPTVSLMVIRRSYSTIRRTFAMNSPVLLVDGLLDSGLLLTEVCPCLKRLYHSFICVIPMASSPKACWIFWIVCTCVSPNLWLNLMQQRCSMRSDIIRWACAGCLNSSLHKRELARTRAFKISTHAQ